MIVLVESYGRLQRHLSREDPTERTPLAPNKTLQYRRRLRITRRFVLWIEIVLGIVRWNTNSLPTACEQEKDGFGRILLSAIKWATDLVAYMQINFFSWQWLTVLPRNEGVVFGGPGIFMWWVNARVRVRKCWLERSFTNSLHVSHTPAQPWTPKLSSHAESASGHHLTPHSLANRVRPLNTWLSERN